MTAEVRILLISDGGLISMGWNHIYFYRNYGPKCLLFSGCQGPFLGAKRSESDVDLPPTSSGQINE